MYLNWWPGLFVFSSLAAQAKDAGPFTPVFPGAGHQGKLVEWQRLESDCLKNLPHACAEAGMALFEASGSDEVYDLAFSRFKMAQKGGASAGYYGMAKMYGEGWGVATNPARARDYFRKAQERAQEGCEEGEAVDCFVASAILEYGILSVPNPEGAYTMAYKACRLGYTDACNSVALAMIEGAGHREDAPGAVPFLVQACDGGSKWACWNLGLYYLGDQYPSPVGINMDTARRYHQRACDLGHDEACEEMSLPAPAERGGYKVAVTRVDDVATITVETRGGEILRDAIPVAVTRCQDQIDAPSCYLAGMYFLSSDERDLYKAKGFLAFSCNLRYLHACVALQGFPRSGAAP